MQKFNYGVVGVRKIGRYKETRCAEKEIVTVPVEAQLGLPPFRTWNVGCAEK